MKTPQWEDKSPLKDGKLWAMYCDGLWITLVISNYPSGWELTCKEVYILQYVIRNTNLDDAKLIALQTVSESIGRLIRAKKQLNHAELAQGEIVYGVGQYQ